MGFENFKKYCETWTDENLQKDLEEFASQFLLDKANEVITRTKPRTPVDTGALRQAWQHSEVRKKGYDYEIDILNGKDYASYVEYGHRGVYVPALGKTMYVGTKYTTGRYMLSTSLNEVENNMAKDFNKRFVKFLNERGIGNG